MRGFGRVYQRGSVWWIAYNVRGKEIRESSHSAKKSDATSLLKQRLEESRHYAVQPSDLRVRDLLADYAQDAELRGVRGMGALRSNAHTIEAEIGEIRARELTTATMAALQRRLAERIKPATVNRVMSVLISALKHAHRSGLIARLPASPRSLRLPPPRQGFLEHEDYLAIRQHLPGWAADIFEFAYVTGWRRSEVLWLTWHEVDWPERMIRLDPRRSKNSEGRLRPILSDLEPVMARRVSARVLGLDYVFHRDGRRTSLDGWIRTWNKAKKAAGRAHLLLHDCRRTAVRNLVRAGVPERVAMQMTGHKTRGVFERYNIVSEDDLRDAARKLKDYMDSRADVAAAVLPFEKKKEVK